MFAILLRLKRKIKKLLKVQTESRQTLQPTARSRTTKIVILLAISVSIGVLYPGEVLYDPLDMPHRGEIASEDIVAPFQISIYKSDDEVKDERAQVRQYTSYILDADTMVVRQAIDSLGSFFGLVERFRAADSVARAQQLPEVTDSLAQRFPMLSKTAISRSLAGQVDFQRALQTLTQIYQTQIYRVGVLRSLTELPESRNRLVLVRRGGEENIYERGRVLDIPLAYARLLTALNQVPVRDGVDVELYYLVGRNFILPNLTVNMAEHERRVQGELSELSNVKEVVNAGDVIVSARHKVTERQEEVLHEMARIMRVEASRQGRLVALLPALARIILALAAFTALYLFLFFFRPDIYRSNPKILALVLVFALQMFLLYLVNLLGLKSIYIYPVAILPIMVTILFDAEVGILSTIVLALLLGVMHRFSFSLTLLTAVIGFVGCLTSRQVRKRSHFYRIMFAIALAYIVLIFLVESLKLTPNAEILTEMVYGLSISILSVLVIIGTLPVFESLFGITTDITLLELSDLNNPVLRRLSIEAPGTYHHSISVGNLCEAAAEAIGGNALLARVGAYYHDIGKIEIPEYFVENQFSVRSKHESLTPSMSSLILSSHVKKGRQLGEEAGLPDEVLNFIEEHHGTMVMSYFYHKAREQEGDGVATEKYRYPGPRPQTRETGIAMLADAVEAASRTLDDPKPARIQGLIQRIINDRFQSGELDECPLTLRDLARIKESFTQVLVAVFHHRVRYPAPDEGPKGS